MERLRVEYKSQLTPSVLRGLDTDIAAFANTEGGEIWFGVDNKGAIAGSELTDKEREQIAQRAALCRPPISVDFEKREVDGLSITVVTIRPSTSVHMDERHRAPVRTGGITDFLDVTGILLLARDRGLEFAASNIQTPFATHRIERSELPRELAESLTRALASQKPDVRVAALRLVERDMYRLRLEKNDQLMSALIDTTKPGSNILTEQPFSVIRSLLIYTDVDEVDRKKWAPRVRGNAFGVLENGNVAVVIQDALAFLAQFAEHSDLEFIHACITEWAEERYRPVNVQAWIHGIKMAGYGTEVEQVLLDLLERTEDISISTRVKECLEYLRRNF